MLDPTKPGGVAKMSQVRLAAADDVLRIVGMIEELREAVRGPIPVDRSHTAQTVARLIASPDGFVAVTDGGFIAGCLTQTIINPGNICQELGWFSRDKTGLALLQAMEAWAAERGALLVQLSTGAEGPDLSRLGYRLAERAWVK